MITQRGERRLSKMVQSVNAWSTGARYEDWIHSNMAHALKGQDMRLLGAEQRSTTGALRSSVRNMAHKM